jgi:mono/diheme cytochrome c family protein
LARWRRTERGLALAGLLAALAGGAHADPVPAPPPALAFARHGEPVASLDLAALAKLVPSARVQVHEPYEDREVAFQALPFADLLDAVYGPGWRGEEELLFTCRDGYQPTVPVARALAHRAWLAYAREGQGAFTIWKLESGERRHVDLAPFYLAWENLDDAVVRQEGDYGWPYQLVGVELIRTRERFPRMAPPAGAPPEVRAGFAAFRVHCSRCHKLNGEGGAIGPELNGAASPLALRERAWLRAWIAEPSRILPTARMEPLAPALPDRERTIDEILAYLAAMAAARSAGDEP